MTLGQLSLAATYSRMHPARWLRLVSLDDLSREILTVKHVSFGWYAIVF